MRVRWLRVALQNLSAEADYIAQDSPRAASAIVEKIHGAVQHLGKYAQLGRPGRVEGTRELVIPGTPYIIPYRIRNKTVEILRVLHAARRWPQKF